MSRSRRNSNPVLGVLFAVALPLGGLILLFSLMPYERMLRDWPLGISAHEVNFFQRLLDRRPKEAAINSLDTIRSREAGSRWVLSWDDHQDTVRAKPLSGRNGAWSITFSREATFHGERAIDLFPAEASSVRYAYMCSLADSVGVPAPEVHVVRWERDGRDAGVFMAIERITPEYLERKGLPDARLLHVGIDGRTIERMEGTDDEAHAAAMAWRKALSGEAAHIDTMAAALVAILRTRYPSGGPAEGPGLFAFDRSNGRIIPLLGGASATDLPTTAASLAALRARFIKERALWEQRFDEVDAKWSAALAHGNDLGLVKARLRIERAEMLATITRDDQHAPLAMRSGAPNDRVIDPWLKDFIGSDDTVRIRRGVHVIDHDILVPVGWPVVVERSVRIKMAPGSSFVVEGPLFIRGTAVNPVFIRPEDAARPFGTVCVNGNGHTRCVIEGLRMSGGSQAWAGERYHSGMLSLHDCDVRIEGSYLGSSSGEDAVNLKRCKATIRGCDFRDGKDDLLDLDMVSGAVDRCGFTGSSAGDTSVITNGDGLDASGSQLVVEGCTFQGLRDKGVSAGEGSRLLIAGCSFNGNGIAIASKDRSVAHVFDCDLVGNATAVAAFQKKPFFGGGELFLYGNRLRGNGSDQAIDGVSRSTSTDRMSEDVRRFFGFVR